MNNIFFRNADVCYRNVPWSPDEGRRLKAIPPKRKNATIQKILQHSGDMRHEPSRTCHDLVATCEILSKCRPVVWARNPYSRRQNCNKYLTPAPNFPLLFGFPEIKFTQGNMPICSIFVSHSSTLYLLDSFIFPMAPK